MKLQVTLLSNDAIPPVRGSEEAAGLDLFSTETTTISPGERAMISTGLTMAIPKGYYGRVAPRSGLAVKHGLDTLAGVVDSDYRGEVKVILQNLSKVPYTVNKGDRIAQLIITPYSNVPIHVVETLEESTRGDGGFGSTGK